MPPKKSEKIEEIQETVQRVVKEALQDANSLQVLVQLVKQTLMADLQATIEKNNTVIKELKCALQQKDEKIVALENRIDDLEQYQRRQCIRIFGVKEEEAEDTDKIATEVARKIGVELDVNDIDRSHRVGRRDTEKPRPIIVKFVSYRKRSEIYRCKRRLKSTGITIRDDLTKARHALLRESISRFGLHNVWTMDGVVIVNHEGTKRRLTRMADLNNM